MFMAFWQVQRLTREINTLERRAMQVRTRLNHYQKYAGRLGGSRYLRAHDAAGLSAELLPRATMFANFSEQASSMSAMQQLQMMKASGMVPWLNNPMMQGQYEMSAFYQFKEQSMKALKQQEVEAMNEIEAEIQLELNTIEGQLKTKRAMLESCQNLLSSQTEKFVPKFGMS